MNLYKQNEALGITFFQVPVALFASGKYAKMSLAAKMAYGLMLNRLQLSSLNGWVNENKEVYIIYTRDQLGKQLNLSYKSSVSIFKELKEYGLIEEQRRGNGLPNHIYLSKVEASSREAEAYSQETGCEETTGQLPPKESETAEPERRCEPNTAPDVSKGQVQTCNNDRSGCVNSTGLDVQNLPPRYIDFSYTEFNQNNRSQIESNQSVSHLRRVNPELEDELSKILSRCGLDEYPEDEAPVLQEAVIRLYYSQSFKTGGAVLPQALIRHQLRRLDGEILHTAYEKLQTNREKVKNSMGYIMAVVYNAISELQGDLLVDPYLNSLRNGEKLRC